MPTRKIADLPRRECRHPEHFPPKHFVPKEDGLYEHTCPACGFSCTFVVSKSAWSGVTLLVESREKKIAYAR